MSVRIVLKSGPILTALFIIAGFVAALALNLPGHLSYDSILQLLQGRTGVYNTWHPPVMAFLLGLGDALVPGAALFVVLQTVLCFGAFLSLLAFPVNRPWWPSACVALASVLLPQLVLYPGLVWKDVLFADAGVAGFVCLAHAARIWQRRSRRVAAILLAFALLGLAALTRQNGILLLPCGAIALGWIATRQACDVRAGLMAGGGALIATSVLVLAATLALNMHSDGESGPQEQFRLLQIYDLSGALAADPGLTFDRLAEDEPALDRVLRTVEAPLYTPVRNDPIASSPPLQTLLRTADDAAIAAQWRSLIVQHPWTYLALRARVFWWVLATPDIVACRPVFVGIEGPAGPLKTLGLAPRKTGMDKALESYARAFMGTPAFSHLFFAAIAGLALGLLLRRRRPEDIAMAFLLLGAFAFAASFFVISIACDYRYLYALDLAALIALFHLSLDVGSVRKGSP